MANVLEIPPHFATIYSHPTAGDRSITYTFGPMKISEIPKAVAEISAFSVISDIRYDSVPPIDQGTPPPSEGPPAPCVLPPGWSDVSSDVEKSWCDLLHEPPTLYFPGVLALLNGDAPGAISLFRQILDDVATTARIRDILCEILSQLGYVCEPRERGKKPSGRKPPARPAPKKPPPPAPPGGGDGGDELTDCCDAVAVYLHSIAESLVHFLEHGSGPSEPPTREREDCCERVVVALTSITTQLTAIASATAIAAPGPDGSRPLETALRAIADSLLHVADTIRVAPVALADDLCRCIGVPLARIASTLAETPATKPLPRVDPAAMDRLIEQMVDEGRLGADFARTIISLGGVQ